MPPDGPPGLPLEHDFQGNRIRVTMKEDGCWFNVADVCTALGHSDPSKAVSRLDEDERDTSIFETPGGPQEMVVCNESGLYALVLTSRKPKARAFRRWVTGTVLPSLRRTAQGSPIDAKPGQVVLGLAVPGRYSVALSPGEAARIERLDDNSHGTLDVEVLALALRTIGCWWQRCMRWNSVGTSPSFGFAADSLERAIVQGGELGAEYLRVDQLWRLNGAEESDCGREEIRETPRDSEDQGLCGDDGLGEGDLPSSGAGRLPVEHDFQGNRIRVTTKEGNCWFVVADVCAALGHSNPSEAVRRLDEDERGISIFRTPGGPQEVVVCSESGLYALIITSQKPKARAFRRWVTGTVLPSLRRAAQGASIDATSGPAILAFDSPGRSSVALSPGEPPRIERLDNHSLGASANADVEVLALALQTIGSWWERYMIRRSIMVTLSDNFIATGLDRVVVQGAELGAEYLRVDQGLRTE
jgi:prophage antirepressor-like protein